MIVEEVQISIGKAYNISKNKIEYRKICARWVSKKTTQEQKIENVKQS